MYDRKFVTLATAYLTAFNIYDNKDLRPNEIIIRLQFFKLTAVGTRLCPFDLADCILLPLEITILSMGYKWGDILLSKGSFMSRAHILLL